MTEPNKDNIVFAQAVPYTYRVIKEGNGYKWIALKDGLQCSYGLCDNEAEAKRQGQSYCDERNPKPFEAEIIMTTQPHMTDGVKKALAELKTSIESDLESGRIKTDILKLFDNLEKELSVEVRVKL